MKERPILFSAPMVRAILECQKSQTRRVVKPQPVLSPNGQFWHWPSLGGLSYWEEDRRSITPRWTTDPLFARCPYGQPGDRLWVRETFATVESEEPAAGMGPSIGAVYRASYDEARDGRYLAGLTWRPSIFMPRQYSRITLEITSVRVERVQEISESDCCKELGAPLSWSGEGPEPYKRDMIGAFANLWDQINTKRGYGWDVNPWVWVIAFRQVTP